MLLLKNKRAQSTAEYAILIGLVVAGAIAMQTYVKRGLQGGVKYAVDRAGKAGGTGQYEPYYLESSFTTLTETHKDTEAMKTNGAVERFFGVGRDKVTRRSGSQITNATARAD